MKNIYIFILFFSVSAVFSQNQLLADFEDQKLMKNKSALKKPYVVDYKPYKYTTRMFGL